MRQVFSRFPRTTFATGGIVFFAIAVPGGISLDQQIDRDRPLYHDVVLFGPMQATALDAGEPVAKRTMRGGTTYDVGAGEFRPTVGVTVRVWPYKGGFCVVGTNEFGTSTETFCGAAKEFLKGGRHHYAP